MPVYDNLPDATRFYINGEWVNPIDGRLGDIINPATEKPLCKIALGGESDVNRAVIAAHEAFPSFSTTPLSDRLDMLKAITAKLIERNNEIADAIASAMGAPMPLARQAQAPSGPQHFMEMINVLQNFEFSSTHGTTKIRREPIGVCALITPWNWPMNQIATKIAPAIAAGCTMVLKPSELAPLDAVILAEIMHEVGVPAGVFNLVHGDGQGVGAPLTAHKLVDMVSFTGSTRAGIAISAAAAPTIKRVALELGGKSAAIILPDADIEAAVTASVAGVMDNTGQSCNARARVLIHESQYEQAAAIAKAVALGVTVGDQESEAHIGPIANKNQYARVIDLIKIGESEGADLLAGGADRPEGFDKGYFVPATVFGNVTPDMTLAREEIFGPVATLIKYKTIEEAIEIANDTDYGLSGAVWSSDLKSARNVASRLRTGMVHINGAGLDSGAPFGGYKMSGNGREWGKYGLEEYLEVKSVYGAETD